MTTLVFPPLGGALATLAHALPNVLMAVRHVAVVLSLRLLPFAAYAVVASSIAIRHRICAVVAYGVVPLAAWSLGAGQTVLLIGLGWTYYLLACLALNPVSRLVGSGQLTRGATLVIAFVLFLLVPGVLLPGIAVFAFLVVGWELALSAYSYCIETSRPGATIPPLRECLFFVLVNPTVVFSVRGQKTGSGETGSGEGAPGWRRAAVGVAVTFANVLALRPAAEYLRAGAPVPWLPASVPMVLLLYGVAQYLSMYAAHSGLASIQIGLMRQIGWAVPERYQYPLLATSPVDFWRRWNTYVRVWLEAYVFLPLAWRAARTTRRGSAPALAAAATLAASAALHAAFVFAGKQTLAGVNVAFFLAAGALLVIWHLVGGWLRRVLVRQDWVAFGRLDLVARWSGRCAVAGAIVAAAATWG